MNNYIVFDIETTGLRATQGNPVTCICAKDHLDNWFQRAGNDETDMIRDFFDYLSTKKDFKLISANGKDFDVPFLLLRAYQSGIQFSCCGRYLVNPKHTRLEKNYEEQFCNNCGTHHLVEVLQEDKK